MTAIRFLQLAEEQGLLDEKVVAQLRKQIQESTKPVSPDQVAKLLVDKQRLTSFQAKQVARQPRGKRRRSDPAGVDEDERRGRGRDRPADGRDHSRGTGDGRAPLPGGRSSAGSDRSCGAGGPRDTAGGPGCRWGPDQDDEAMAGGGTPCCGGAAGGWDRSSCCSGDPAPHVQRIAGTPN